MVSPPSSSPVKGGRLFPPPLDDPPPEDPPPPPPSPMQEDERTRMKTKRSLGRRKRRLLTEFSFEKRKWPFAQRKGIHNHIR
jgi:hypothetical protein